MVGELSAATGALAMGAGSAGGVIAGDTGLGAGSVTARTVCCGCGAGLLSAGGAVSGPAASTAGTPGLPTIRYPKTPAKIASAIAHAAIARRMAFSQPSG